MDILAENIAATCPAAFTGNVGDIFIHAVTTLVAAHCAILDGMPWPKDNAQEIISKSSGFTPSYDFIIVGAGTAGSLVAGELSKRLPSSSFLLVEAGDDPGIESEIPSFLFMNQNTNSDWKYKTKPDGQSCLGFIDDSCQWSKGKGMGGSSSINAMLYIRGHPKDFEQWAESTSEAWSYKDLLPYFNDIENKLNLTRYKYQDLPWYNILKEAWQEIGVKPLNKDNNEALVGTKITKLLTKDGKRFNTGKLFLNDTRNLHVMKNSIVQRVIVDPKSQTVIGVDILHSSGNIVKVDVNNEVILSTGTVATPQILMFSGIGPKEILNDNGIDCIIDLPVGKNLQDHLLLPLYLQTNINQSLPLDTLTRTILQYILSRSGPLSHIGLTDFMAFVDTDEIGTYPDMQFHHSIFPARDYFTLKPYLKGIKFKDEIIQEVAKYNQNSALLVIYPTLLHPKSKGEITVNGNDPQSKPVIKTNYFQNPDDIKTFLSAISFVRKLQFTEKFKALEIKMLNIKLSNCSQFIFETADYWECYIRHMATTLYHPVGTAKMGKDPHDSVVDFNLMVHGMQNLRVVDASVMPTIPGSNTMAPTLAIAAKAVDIIAEHFTKVKDEL